MIRIFDLKRLRIGFVLAVILSLFCSACQASNSYEDCAAAVMRGRPMREYKAQGLGDAIALAITKCMSSEESPGDYARNHVWTTAKPSEKTPPKETPK